jgi:hypothetical protein
MGNAQSTSEERKQVRVSKPRTLPSARSSNVPSPLQKEFSVERNVTIGIPYPASEVGESPPNSPSKFTIRDGNSQQDLRHAIRSHLLSPTNTSFSKNDEDEQLGVMAATVARSLSRSGSRFTDGPSAKSSLVKLHSASSQLSLSTDRSVDLETAVALLHELRKTASPDDLVALRMYDLTSPESYSNILTDQALLPLRSIDQCSPTTRDIAEEEAEEAMGTTPAALIRQKSLARPGIATRHRKAEEKKQEPEPGMSVHDRLWKREMMHDSPLELLSNLDPLEPPIQIVENRAATPGDREYSHLGSLKIGSLVVTNGLASPAPSFVSRDFTNPRRPSSEPRLEDEYFTASEGGSPRKPTYEDDGSPLPELPPLEHRRPSTAAESTLSFEQPRTPERTGRTGQLASRRSGSPLKREIHAENLRFGDDRDSLYSRQPRAVVSAISLTALSENHSLFENTSSDEETKWQHARHRADSQSAISLASEYMAEMPPSPYARSRLQQSRALPPTPSHESLEFERAGSFENGPANLEYQEIEKYRETPADFDELENETFEDLSVDFDQREIDEALGLPDSDMPPREEISPHTALRSHPPSNLALKSALKNKPQVSAKTDSGYSSGCSNPGAYEDMFYDAEQSHGEDVRLHNEAQAGAEPTTPDQRGRSPDYWDTLRKLEGAPKQTPIKSDESEQTQQKKVERSRSLRKSIRKSLPRMLSSNNTPTGSSNSSTPETKSESKAESKAAAKQQKKLQKKRPLSQPPLSFGGMRSLTDGDIPRVPSAVYSRFSMRLAESPGMEHLEQTYENATSGDSRRGSASPSPAVICGTLVPASYFPDSEGYDSPVGKVKRLSKAIDSGGPPPPPIHRHSMQASRRVSRGNTPPKNTEDEIIGVADFGTVARSLGGSPYDAAMSANSQRPTSAAPQVPHQFSTNRSQSGPREGWDAETASKFARMRSDERAAALEAAGNGSPAPRPESKYSHPTGRPPMDARHSYHEQRSTPQRRPQNNVLPRPRSMHGNGMDGPHETQSQNPYRLASIPSQDPIRPSTSSTVSSFRPTSTSVTTTSSFQPPRSSTPVKNLVNAFEQKAAASPSSPSLRSQESYDWTEQSRVWRERRLQAHTTVQTSSTKSANASTTTTTTVTSFASALRPQPSMSPLPRTPNQRMPFTQRQSEPAYLPTQKSEASRSRRNQSPTPEPSPIPMGQNEAARKSFGDEGIFGRYGGGFRNKRDHTFSANAR